MSPESPSRCRSRSQRLSASRTWCQREERKAVPMRVALIHTGKVERPLEVNADRLNITQLGAEVYENKVTRDGLLVLFIPLTSIWKITWEERA